MKKIALLPGGFKPPHAGHYNMAKYLAKETNADVVVVKVGAKEREGVTREMSMQLWNLYKESDSDPISDKLLIQPSTSNSPVRDVYDFIEDTAPEGSMVYLGMGEKDTNDSRFANIGKFAEPRNIQFQTTLVPPQAGGVSGTEMRGFIRNNQDTFFFNALPDHMSEKDKQDAWDIVTRDINEDLYDPNDHVSDYMKSSEYKAGMPDGPKKDITPSYKYKRGGLYGKMYNETVTDTDIICDNCGWTWAIVDGGDDLYICHTCGHDNSPVDEMMMGTMNNQEKAKHNKNMKRLSKDLKKQGNQYKKVPSYIKGTLKRKMKESTFSKNWWKDIINEILLSEGGAAGHMAHPFDLPNVTSGRDLVNVFEQAANSLQTNPGAVKIDGVNSSIRLIDVGGTKQFAMDRGSKKDLDIKGITKADLEDRFSPGHGMIKVGGEVLDMFNKALPAIQNDLKKLGVLDDPSILFNMEYVAGKTNVQEYSSNFIAIHGLNKVKMEEVPGRMYRGKPLVKRYSQEFNYDKGALQSLLDNLAPIAKKRGFEVYGSVPTQMKAKPNFRAALSKRYTVETTEGAQTKPLGQWLEGMDNIPIGEFIFMNVGSTKKKVGAVSKQVYLAILKGENIDELFEDQGDKQKAIDGFATYLGTEKLGDEILKVLDSPMGSVENHEGVVVRDEKIAKIPFKITGKFILGGLQTGFR